MVFSKHLTNFLLAFVPDALIAWAYVKLSDGGWPEFWYVMIALQALYFVLWLKQAGWSWLLYWIYQRRTMADSMEKFFREHKFPAPEAWVGGLDDYLDQILLDDDAPTKLKATASFEKGTLNGMKLAQRYSLVMMMESATRLAMSSYRRNPAKPEVENPVAAPTAEDVLGMSKDELETVAWLADWGLRFWIFEDYKRSFERLTKSKAEMYANVLEMFERRIVQNLLHETETDKQRRFDRSENRMHNIWQAYPS